MAEPERPIGSSPDVLADPSRTRADRADYADPSVVVSGNPFWPKPGKPPNTDEEPFYPMSYFTHYFVRRRRGQTGTGPPPPTSSLTVSPTSLTFTAQVGSTPSSQSFTVSNPAGLVGLTVTEAPDQPWMSLTVNAVTGVVTVTPSTPSVPGNYPGSIQVAQVGANNTPRTVSVNFTVTGSTLVLSATSVSFSGVQGGADPAPQTVTVSGTGVSVDSVVEVIDASWLTVAFDAATGVITLTPSISGLTSAASPYSATVRITDSGASNSPQNIAVSFTVQPQVTPTTNILTLSVYTEVESRFASTENYVSNGFPLSDDPAVFTLVAADLPNLGVFVNGVESDDAYVESHVRPYTSGRLRGLFLQTSAPVGATIELRTGQRTKPRVSLRTAAWWDGNNRFNSAVRDLSAPWTVGFPYKYALPSEAYMRSTRALGRLNTVDAAHAAHKDLDWYEQKWEVHSEQHWSKTPPGMPGYEWAYVNQGLYSRNAVMQYRIGQPDTCQYPWANGTGDLNIDLSDDNYEKWRSGWSYASGGSMSINYYDIVRWWFTRRVRGNDDTAVSYFRRACVVAWHVITQHYWNGIAFGHGSAPPPWYQQPDGVYLYWLFTRANCAKDVMVMMSDMMVNYVPLSYFNYWSASTVNINGVDIPQMAAAMDLRAETRALMCWRIAWLMNDTSRDRKADYIAAMTRSCETGADRAYVVQSAGRGVWRFNNNPTNESGVPDPWIVTGFMVNIRVDEMWRGLETFGVAELGQTLVDTMKTRIVESARYMWERCSEIVDIGPSYGNPDGLRRVFYNYFASYGTQAVGGQYGIIDLGVDKSGVDLTRMHAFHMALAYHLTGDTTFRDRALECVRDGRKDGQLDALPDSPMTNAKQFNENSYCVPEAEALLYGEG